LVFAELLRIELPVCEKVFIFLTIGLLSQRHNMRSTLHTYSSNVEILKFLIWNCWTSFSKINTYFAKKCQSAIISLWRKVVCLFCFVCTNEIHWTRMLQIVFLVSLESSQRGGVHGAWFHDVWSCGAKVLEYWMISSLKIKLNRSWKFRRNPNVPLVLERSWWAGFNGIYLVRFGFRMCGRFCNTPYYA